MMAMTSGMERVEVRDSDAAAWEWLMLLSGPLFSGLG